MRSASSGVMLLGVACLSGFSEVRTMGVGVGLLVVAGACFGAGVDTQGGVTSGGNSIVGVAGVKTRKKRRFRGVSRPNPSTLTQYWS